jgi:valyl-tRNA synthetase
MLKWGEQLNWHPKFMKSRYDNWVKGLQWDWLISNQRYFGVPFPVWYCGKCGEPVLADEKQLPVDPMKDKPAKKCSCGNSRDFEPDRGPRPVSGFIGLQNHDSLSTVYFKEVAVRSLK